MCSPFFSFLPELGSKTEQVPLQPFVDKVLGDRQHIHRCRADSADQPMLIGHNAAGQS